jgi:hypothetical protein
MSSPARQDVPFKIRNRGGIFGPDYLGVLVPQDHGGRSGGVGPQFEMGKAADVLHRVGVERCDAAGIGVDG